MKRTATSLEAKKPHTPFCDSSSVVLWHEDLLDSIIEWSELDGCLVAPGLIEHVEGTEGRLGYSFPMGETQMQLNEEPEKGACLTFMETMNVISEDHS